LDFTTQYLRSNDPLVMGVLNITPDSFSDGGSYPDLAASLRRVEQMVAEGASIIDIGGESTRPGARPVSVQEELDRVMPPVQRIVRDIGIPVSVDTSKPEVMEEALRAGAAMINDVRALRAPGALEVVAASQAPVCLMHMQGTPTTMQREPRYRNVVAEVKDFLEDRLRACERAGIGRDRTIVDPGFGFGKTLAHNLSLLNNIGRLRELGVALLVGLSRKSMLGAILDAPVEERLYGGLAAAVLAVWQGAHIVRTHDVGPTVEALRVCGAVRSAE
jgi:dihydropteroate synthase